MTNILELARQQAMQQATQQQNEPTPTENAQLMIHPTFAAPAVIFRFNSAKKGRKAYEDVVKAWKAHGMYIGNGKQPTQYYEIKADMFDGVIDFSRIAAINFVEWPKRGKFVPRIV